MELYCRLYGCVQGSLSLCACCSFTWLGHSAHLATLQCQGWNGSARLRSYSKGRPVSQSVSCQSPCGSANEGRLTQGPGPPPALRNHWLAGVLISSRKLIVGISRPLQQFRLATSVLRNATSLPPSLPLRSGQRPSCNTSTPAPPP